MHSYCPDRYSPFKCQFVLLSACALVVMDNSTLPRRPNTCPSACRIQRAGIDQWQYKAAFLLLLLKAAFHAFLRSMGGQRYGSHTVVNLHPNPGEMSPQHVSGNKYYQCHHTDLQLSYATSGRHNLGRNPRVTLYLSGIWILNLHHAYYLVSERHILIRKQ